MKTNLLLSAFLITASSVLAQSSNPQTWTDSFGRVIRGKFVRLDGNAVMIEINGRVLKTPFTNLSSASVALAKKLGSGGHSAEVSPAEGPSVKNLPTEMVKGAPTSVLPPAWEKRHLDVLALFENFKQPTPAANMKQPVQNGSSAPEQSVPYRNFLSSPKSLISLTEGVPSLTVVGEVARRIGNDSVYREETDAMTSDSILINRWLMTDQGAVNLKRELQLYFQTKKEVRIEHSHFIGKDLFLLCWNVVEGDAHVFRYDGKLEYLYNLTQHLRDIGIAGDNEGFTRGQGGDADFSFARGEVASFTYGHDRLVHVSPQGARVLALAPKGSRDLYTQEGAPVGTRGDEKFPSRHPDGTISTITERLFPANNRPPRQGLVFFKDGMVDRISPQEIATGVLGVDAQPRSVTTPSGSKADLQWEMRVHGKTVGQDGRLYLVLEAKYDRASPAGLVTEQKSWHIAAVDGRRVIPLFHSGEQPALSVILKEVSAIAPQPDGSVYARLSTQRGYMLGRVADGQFRVLWIDGTKYVDEAGLPCTLSESNRPILAHNSHFIMPRRNAKGELPYVVCEDTDLTPLIQAAEAGEMKAMTLLAGRCLKGDGVQKDPARAIQLYEKAAALGERDALFELGYCHSEGKGVEQNEENAAAWFLKAANAGHSMALYNLGVCYENARGVPKDEGRAFDCYIQAAQQGLPAAYFILAVSYDTGIGSFVLKDAKLANALCVRAAQLGSMDAKNALERHSKQWRQSAVVNGMENIRQAQDDAAYRARRKMRDFEEQQAGRYPR